MWRLQGKLWCCSASRARASAVCVCIMARELRSARSHIDKRRGATGGTRKPRRHCDNPSLRTAAGPCAFGRWSVCGQRTMTSANRRTLNGAGRSRATAPRAAAGTGGHRGPRAICSRLCPIHHRPHEREQKLLGCWSAPVRCRAQRLPRARLRLQMMF